MYKVIFSDFINKILTLSFVKKLFVPAIFLTLGLIVFFWFGDYLFAGTDVYFPVRRSASMFNHLFTWISISTGIQSISAQIMIPYGLFLIISEKINLSLPITQHIWFYYIFVLSGLSAYLFSKQIIKKMFNMDAVIPAVIAGIIYMANPFVAVMSSTFTYQWLVYASMPLILYLVIIGFGTPPKFKNTFFRVLLFFVVSSSVNTNPKYLILAIMPCVFLLIIYLCFENNKTAIKHTLTYNIQFFSLLILFNLYWLIPQIYLIKDSIANVRQAYESLGAPRSREYLYNSASGVLSGISLIGHKALTGNYAGIAYYKYSNLLFSPLYRIIELLPFFLSLYVIISKKKTVNAYAYIFCIFMLVFSIFGMLGSTMPAFQISSYFVEKVPLFLDLFANPYPIFSIYYLIALSAFISLSIFILKTKIIHLKSIVKVFIAVILVASIFLIGKPVWTGELIRKSNFEENKSLTSHLYKIPDYYYLIKNKISAESTNGVNFRILSIPYPTQGIVVYQWEKGGYSGGEVGSGWIGDILQGTNLATKSLINKILKGEIITDDLAHLGIRYIIFHKDANPLMYNGVQLYGGGKQMFEKNIIDSLIASDIQYEASNFGSVIFYTLNHNNLNLKASLSNQDLSQDLTKYKEKTEEIAKSFDFLPHFYTSSSLIIPSASINDFFSIFPTQDYGVRSLIYFKEQNASIPNKVIEMGEEYVPLFIDDNTIADNNVSNTIVNNNINEFSLKKNVNSNSVIQVNYINERKLLIFSKNIKNNILINGQFIKESPNAYEVSAKIGDIVKSGRKFIVIRENTNESISLSDGVDIYKKGTDLSSFNLNVDLSFESGLWQEKPSDCASGMEGEPDLSMQLSNDAIDGKNSLEIGSKNHSACVSKSFPVYLNKNIIYKYSFDYKNVKGDELILYYNLKGKERSYQFSEVVKAKDREWNHYETFIEPKEDISSIDLYFYSPSDGTKEVVNRFDNVQLEDLEWVDSFNVEKNSVIVQENVKLNEGENKIEYIGDQVKVDLIKDASFESGLWQEKPSDCASGMEGEPDLSMQLSNDAIDGKNSLEIGSKNHSACVSKSFPVYLNKNIIYKYSFDYKNVKGDELILYYNLKGKERSYQFSEVVKAKDREWNHYETFIEPKEDISSIDLYFYSPSDGTKEVVNRFDNVQLVEWMPKDIFNYYLYSPAKEKIETPVIEFRKINPTKYRIRIHGAKGDFPLVFSESFHEGWKAYLAKPDSYKVESYKVIKSEDLDNYKILDGNADDQASGEELAEYISKGWVTDLGNGKEKKIEHKKWEDSKEKLDYVEKYNIDFVSKNFQDTIQNDNLPGGNIFETWFSTSYKVESGKSKELSSYQVIKSKVGEMLQLNKNVIELPEENHLTANGYANSWWIELNEVCKGGKFTPVKSGEASAEQFNGVNKVESGEGNCVKNADGSYDFEMVVEFWPQRLFYIGLGISGLTLLGCLSYLYWTSRRRIKESIKSIKLKVYKVGEFVKSGEIKEYLKLPSLKVAESAKVLISFLKLRFRKFDGILKRSFRIFRIDKPEEEKQSKVIKLSSYQVESQKAEESIKPKVESPKKQEDNIDWDFIKAKKEEIEQRLDNKFKDEMGMLWELGCLDVDGELNMEGVLLFGKDPQKYNRNSYLTVAKYDRSHNLEENMNFKGNLPKIIEESYEAIKKLIPTKDVINSDSARREKVPKFPYVAVRELLINTIAHRDYSISGSRIIISMYDNRMEFQSPGNLPNGITPETILRSQYSRNPIIAEALSGLGYMEQLGSGIDRTFQIFKDLKKKKPKIENFENMVIVTIFK